jgi:hypothetical protein
MTTKIKQIKQITTFLTFHRTLCGRVRENNTRAQEALEKLEPLIRWLKNNTDSHLQQSTHNQKQILLRSILDQGKNKGNQVVTLEQPEL